MFIPLFTRHPVDNWNKWCIQLSKWKQFDVCCQGFLLNRTSAYWTVCDKPTRGQSPCGLDNLRTAWTVRRLVNSPKCLTKNLQ